MQTKILLDTDCALDLLLDRGKRALEVEKVIGLSGTLLFAISVTSISNLFYIGKVKDRNYFADFLMAFATLGMNRKTIVRALAYGFKDFEDAMQLACAEEAGYHYLLTWNIKDYKQNRSAVKVVTPNQFRKQFSV